MKGRRYILTVSGNSDSFALVAQGKLKHNGRPIGKKGITISNNPNIQIRQKQKSKAGFYAALLFGTLIVALKLCSCCSSKKYNHYPWIVPAIIAYSLLVVVGLIVYIWIVIHPQVDEALRR